ncbi:pyrroline-5-carboxylate reductase [Sinirhodobacter populi]|uniref:Pyrroline-5-carboxylate reductase n=1 Tax=Paenirhodobacter populi TaxID=2306993 RepID=A0A443K1Q2_9RHOB|nr:pyrroline-5-carboxylate reductase [Sinirhodobacter populi]RWR26689.1 pyrroline-5-carboxylate reductase [Sinirhodobacter populi]
MDFNDIESRGLILLGGGKMGSALLAGWLGQGLSPRAVHVVTPHPSDWLVSTGVSLAGDLPDDPAVVLIAVKPQKMAEALPQLARFGGGRTLFVSVAAGKTLASYEAILGAGTPVVRAMPNTPSAIGQGITAIIGNAAAGAADLALAEGLLRAVGDVVRLDAEDQMDAVTAVSGSGPAYVFHLIETLAAAGEAEGLSPDLALRLAKATVAGAGALAQQSGESPAQLRVNVTSPGGTTAAALNVLMDEKAGFPALLQRAVKAAADRGRELGK